MSSSATILRQPKRAAFMRDAGRHLPVLDAVRGLAILLVMLYHFETNALRGIEVQGARVAGYPAHFMSFGWCGVDLFFVLSGFLITGILYDARHDRHYFRNFYMRRTLRIFPLYYATLAIVAVGIAIALRKPHHSATLARLAPMQWWVWIYATNIKLTLAGYWSLLQGGSFSLGHFWSLAVEEHFYLLWPAIVLTFSRKSLMRLCVVLMVGALALRVAFAWRENYVGAYALTPCRMDGLAVGAWIALAARAPLGTLSLKRLAMIVAPLAAIGVVSSAAWYGHLDPYDFGTITVGLTCLVLFFGAVLALVIGLDPASRLGRLLSPAWIRSLGRYSYAIYVLHPFLNPLVTRHVLHTHPVAVGVWVTVVFFCLISYAIGWLSWHLFESHFLKLKRFFPHSTPAAPLVDQKPFDLAAGHFNTIMGVARP